MKWWFLVGIIILFGAAGWLFYSLSRNHSDNVTPPVTSEVVKPEETSTTQFLGWEIDWSSSSTKLAAALIGAPAIVLGIVGLGIALQNKITPKPTQPTTEPDKTKDGKEKKSDDKDKKPEDKSKKEPKKAAGWRYPLFIVFGWYAAMLFFWLSYPHITAWDWLSQHPFLLGWTPWIFLVGMFLVLHETIAVKALGLLFWGPLCIAWIIAAQSESFILVAEPGKWVRAEVVRGQGIPPNKRIEWNQGRHHIGIWAVYKNGFHEKLEATGEGPRIELDKGPGLVDVFFTSQEKGPVKIYGQFKPIKRRR